jgi:hypothetical protein
LKLYFIKLLLSINIFEFNSIYLYCRMLQFNVLINHKIICDKSDQYFKNLIEYKKHFKKFCSICNNRLTNKEFCHLSDIKLSNNKAIIFKITICYDPELIPHTEIP